MNVSSFPEMYERWLVGPLFRPWAEIVLERARLAAGDRVLDVACGTGIVARLAKERLGVDTLVVGVDISPQMLAVARAVAPGIDWREGNAQALPLKEGERFDVVLCQLGLQFFPDKPAAAGEMRRAMDRGGRLVVAVWRSLEHTPCFRDLHRVAEARLGEVVDRRHGYGDPVSLERLLADAGFEDVRVETVTRTIRFADGAAFLRLNTMALVGMSAASSTMTDDERAKVSGAIVEDSAGVLKEYTDTEGLSFDIGANVATAHG
jgi:ubiquinone/menaquinone biosynthesis C-methylase UbiE